MKEFKIYNFNHKFPLNKTFEVGPFIIEVTKLHIENLKKLKSYGAVELTLTLEEDRAKRVVNKKEKLSGETVEAAIVKIQEDKITASKLYNDIAGRMCVDDLCLLLSFLTGRSVFLEDEILDDHSRHYKLAPIDIFSVQTLIVAWDRIESIPAADLNAAFYNLILATQSSEYHSLVSYSSSVLNVIYENWNSKLEKTIHFDKKFKNDFVRKANDTLKPLIDTVTIPNTIKSDIDVRFNGTILGLLTPSAVFKIKQLLVGCDLYPEDDDSELSKRVQWLNWVRNAVAHRGDLPMDRAKGLDFEKIATISASVAAIILSICQYYFAKHVIGIEDDNLINAKEELVEYFTTGTFRDMKVFEETYEEYMIRLEESWVNNGEYL